MPTLAAESSREVKATFFRLVPTLVQMAWEDLGDAVDRRRESRASLGLLETILLEVSSVRLAPVESGMLFKSLDQLATLIAAGEYALARDVVAVPLLGILRKNRVARSLFRLMEVEVALQVYLKERLGHATPRIRIPEDVPALSEFGPLRVFDEEGPDGVRRTYLQVQLPDIPILSDIVVHLSRGRRGRRSPAAARRPRQRALRRAAGALRDRAALRARPVPRRLTRGPALGRRRRGPHDDGGRASGRDPAWRTVTARVQVGTRSTNGTSSARNVGRKAQCQPTRPTIASRRRHVDRRC